MLTTLKIDDTFAAVPWLPKTSLMHQHGGKMRFSTRKPNIIIGPNGAGKSALLDTIALRFLAHFFHQSALDWHYVSAFLSHKEWWGGLGDWRREYTWLPGLHCVTDQAPILYYRPAHMPGNENSVAAAMMTGYFESARAYADMTAEKSSGQKTQALLERIQRALQGDGTALPKSYATVNWSGSVEPCDLRVDGTTRHWSETDYLAEAVKAVATPKDGAVPMLVLDEPEQSLDARAEMLLWRNIERCDTSRMQVIVATHSLYPILHPSKFNIIETEDGYAKSVLDLAIDQA